METSNACLQNQKPLTNALLENSENKLPDTNAKQGAQSGRHFNAVEYIFSQFSLNYGHVWTSQMSNKQWAKILKRQWYEKIREMNLHDIYHAIKFLGSNKNTEFKKFPPNVLEFCQLPKRIKENNIPSEMDCYEAAIQSQWDLHPIVKPIAEACNVYWLKRQASDTEGRRRFSKYYTAMKEKFLRDESLCSQKQLPASVRGIPSTGLSLADEVERRAIHVLSITGMREKINNAKTSQEKRAVSLAAMNRIN